MSHNSTRPAARAATVGPARVSVVAGVLILVGTLLLGELDATKVTSATLIADALILGGLALLGTYFVRHQSR